MNAIYTDEHLEFLRSTYPSMRIRELTRAFNEHFGMAKTPVAIHTLLTRNHIQGGRKKPGIPAQLRSFTLEQKEFIEAGYKRFGLEELVLRLNERFGIQKTGDQVKSFTGRHRIHSGRTGRFEKGHLSWNAGTKGMGLTGANPGSFKKGDRPKNWTPLGTERISRDGYIEIKVAERNPYTGHPTRYRMKHVVVWESVHGPVPDGKIVIFLDGDKSKCEIGNLACITRAEGARLNQFGYTDLPKELKPVMLTLVQLKVKAFSLGRSRAEEGGGLPRETTGFSRLRTPAERLSYIIDHAYEALEMAMNNTSSKRAKP